MVAASQAVMGPLSSEVQHLSAETDAGALKGLLLLSLFQGHTAASQCLFFLVFGQLLH